MAHLVTMDHYVAGDNHADIATILRHHFSKVMNISRPLDLETDDEAFSVQVHVH